MTVETHHVLLEPAIVQDDGTLSDSALLSGDDTLRQEQIRQLVDSRTSGRIRGLQVAVTGPKVVISGRAATYYSKQLATHAALDAADTLVIQNDVVVG